jgi:raffinose/stachyose/melibiose transport system substrate-binding protein
VHQHGAEQTLTLWSNGSLSSNPEVALQIKGFEKLHPGVTIKTVAEPGSNYFTLLQAALISGKVPDIVYLFAGSYLTPLTPYLVNLAGPHLATSLGELKRIPEEAIWTKSGSLQGGTYAVPEENQFYNAFYNKALFRKAGIPQPPRDWSQLYADCAILKKAHITPMVYGNDGNGGEFQPWFDWSYLLAGALPLSSWSRLIDGKLSYDNPAIVAQLAKWAKLGKNGCINSNALTNSANQTQFEQNKAAMFVEGSWDIPTFANKLKGNLGVFIPPYSNAPRNMIVQYPGGGFGVPKSSGHVKLAVQFLAYVMSPAGQRDLSRSGEIPVMSGYSAPNALSRTLLNMGTNKQFNVFPMFDNYMPSSVLSVANKALDQVLVGQLSPTSALQELAQAESDLPSSQRNVSYPL